MESLNEKLVEMGINLDIKEDKVVIKSYDELKSCKIKTEVYPGFPTDLQQVLASLMTIAKGDSEIQETIWENRFLNLYELMKMGAKIKINGDTATITGPAKLKGTEVNATDLRAGAGLVVAALIAPGKTVINNADYILRGYENIVEKLKSLGADIELV